MTKKHQYPITLATVFATIMVLTACGSSQKTETTYTEAKSYHFQRIDGTTSPAQQATRTLHFKTTGTTTTGTTTTGQATEGVQTTQKATQKQSGTATVSAGSKKSTK
ncbi:MAG: hypothetical protein K5683_12125 [Prevotella sp.]|nr:hypothetical protein [Prevotella sp.]